MGRGGRNEFLVVPVRFRVVILETRGRASILLCMSVRLFNNNYI
jgi:hypothetical protein